jgi:hypothetical protein
MARTRAGPPPLARPGAAATTLRGVLPYVSDSGPLADATLTAGSWYCCHGSCQLRLGQLSASHDRCLCCRGPGAPVSTIGGPPPPAPQAGLSHVPQAGGTGSGPGGLLRVADSESSVTVVSLRLTGRLPLSGVTSLCLCQ